MKHTLTLFIFYLLTQNSISQNTHIDSNYIDTVNHYMEKIGSCGAEDGVMLEITTSPGSYQELEDGGYCYSGINSTSNVTMCFSFIAGASNILLNAGYSESCVNNNFTAFRLYNSSCSLVSTSLNPTGLTIGEQYTWCIRMRSWGGGSCNGYDTFCPYWINNEPLSVKLVEFKGDCNKLTWTTASELNSSHFLVNYSNDGVMWTTYKSISSVGTSNSENNYDCLLDIHGANYYRLVEVDFNGNSTICGTLFLNCSKDKVEIESVYSLEGKLLGNKIPEKEGVYVIFYKNNQIGKIVKFK